MALIRWSPYRGVANINHELENIFEEFGLPLWKRWQGEGEGEGNWLPAIDLSETKDGYLLKAELPGVAKEDVKITLTEDVLTLTGEKKYEKESKDHNVHRSERVYGTFTRSFRLPGPVASDKVKAEYKDGVLTLSVPTTENARPREIQIQ